MHGAQGLGGMRLREQIFPPGPVSLHATQFGLGMLQALLCVGRQADAGIQVFLCLEHHLREVVVGGDDLYREVGRDSYVPFVQPVLDITAGDTVIFENDDRNFHNVVFKGALQDPPPGITILVDPGGRGINYAITKDSATAVDPPPEGFDDTTFLSSGSMGVTLPRLTWQVKFDRPGRYIYNCTIHVLAGMAGVINVSPP